MKRNILFIAMGALVLLSACTKKPWADVEEGSWNNDRKILDIKFAGQAGPAKVKDVDETTGTITVQLATNLVTDMSRVAVEVLDISYKAQSTVQRGDFIDFSGEAAPVITVTSATGKSRAYTIDMTPFTETLVGKYAITGSKVWGGTGPEYGGAAVMSPEAKSWCWYSDEGYGPAAEYDDYLEITFEEVLANGNSTGKCIHYGGVNGKHWNCLFKAKYNKDGETDIDLHKFYRQIPVGESTWVRDYTANSITFTSADGTVSLPAELYPAGTYPVYTGKEIVVEDYALAFKIPLAQGWAQDDWRDGIIYTDYDKFVRRPRLYAIMVRPVAEIPAESKTEGTEGKNTVDPPTPPAPVPVFELPGDWMVTEQWVYGGCSAQITKDQTTSKTWCWNSNYAREKDNILSFTPASEGSLSGKLFYGPGADGAYWDYLYVGKKAGVTVDPPIDCSKYYGWLPHTETTYTYNPDDKTPMADGTVPPAGTVAIKINSVITYNVPVLVPGTYTFLGKSALVIREGCMALALPLNDAPASDDTYKNSDYDRFVHSPLLYVMVFTKQVPAE